MARPHNLDTIYLRDLKLSTVIGPDAWNRPGKTQPVTLSLQLQLDISNATTSDDIAHTFSYGQICKDLTGNIERTIFSSLDHMVATVAGLASNWPGEVLSIQAVAPKGLLRVEEGYRREVLLRRNGGGFAYTHWRVEALGRTIKGLKLACIIGVNPHERLEKQTVSINLMIPDETEHPEIDFKTGEIFATWRHLVKRLCDVVEASTFQTLEALAGLICQISLDEFPINKITVSVEKPSALTFVAGAGVELTRSKKSVITPIMSDAVPLKRGKKPEKRKAPGIHTEEWMLNSQI